MANQLNQALIKENNKRKIIHALWENSPVSRTGLAQLTQLNKATITNLLGEIIEEGMVRDVGQQKASVGRHRNLIMFNENYGLAAGLLIRHSMVNLAISDVFAKIVWEHTIHFSDSEEPLDVLHRVIRKLKEGISASASTSTNLLGIGIGTASLLRKPDDMMYAIHSTLKWFDVPVGEFFRQQFQVPIIIDTASNNSMVGEKFFGVAKNYSNAVFLSIGQGIGAGLLVDGQLYRGSNGFAGDIGHFVIDPNGPLCRCGNKGCWEILASGLALPDGITLEDAGRQANLGDPNYIGILSNIGKNLGRGVANIVRLMNPESVILGGYINAGGKWVMNPCRTELQATLWPFVWEPSRVEFAGLENKSAIIGSLTQVIKQLFSLDIPVFEKPV